MDPIQLGLIASILSGVCTAAWTVLTWRQQQDKEEEAKRDRNAALYVNPFILAAEELQDALYNYLSGNYHKLPGEETRQGYAGFSAAALEIVYTIVIYFGWSFTIYRYGPYTSDEKLIELTRQVSEMFSDITHASEAEEDAFYFSYPEQKALGLTFVKPTAIAYAHAGNAAHLNTHLPQVESQFPSFESISLYDFEEQIKNQRNERSALYLNIRDALHAIDKAQPTADFTGRRRLVRVQNYLVDLVNYLEEKEGFSVSVSKRRRARHHLTFAQLFGYIDLQVAHHIPGRLRLKFPVLKNNMVYGVHFESFFFSLEGVKDVRVNLQACSIVIEYDIKKYSMNELEATLGNYIHNLS
ncbi:HMA2 domain-containing protein [Synechococcus sp. PCC 6312]|uniref:HMA2 domain-containing protein n=1 Tax=Synechococcus sp. (strain ATCC 27167 / PCC 6312) TaxID=195253 RepID=UPI00029F0F22|nr:hypothetical protein [Synechococcus sp. PCC 6312]AFY61289.1 hypothetical protein Syn6312_2172 [Synechococcus sp. PCC 6312]